MTVPVIRPSVNLMRRHPFETEIMMRFWRTLAGDDRLAPAEQVTTLEQADALLRARRVPEGPAA